MPRGSKLPGNRVPEDRVANRFVHPHDVGPVPGTLGAVAATNFPELLVVPRVAMARQRGRRIGTELVASTEHERLQVAPVEKDSTLRRTVRGQLPLAGLGRGRQVELRRLGAVVLTRGDDAGGRGLADLYTAIFAWTVGNHGKGARARRVESRRVIGKIVPENRMGGRDDRRVGRDTRRRVHGAQVRMVSARCRVEGVEHGDVRDRRDAIHLCRREVGDDLHRDLVPVQDDVGSSEGGLNITAAHKPAAPVRSIFIVVAPSAVSVQEEPGTTLRLKHSIRGVFGIG